jgi:hypothetical protein
MSVSSYVGGGRHGHLCIIMTNEEYFPIAASVFPVPDNLGASAEVVAGMTAAVISELTRLHREATQVYRTYHNVDQAIKKMILEAFDDAYLNDILDEVVDYANCTSLGLLTHLLTSYAIIAPTELTQNYERLNTPYDPNQTIETLLQQIKDAGSFAVAGGQLYDNAMIINVAYTLIFNTGLFPDAYRAWKSRAMTGKTGAQFKIDFATAHREFRLTNQTTQHSRFHSANMMIEQSWPESMNETAESIAHWATVTDSDRSTMSPLTTTNDKLASQLEVANALISQLKNEIATLKNKIKPLWQGQRTVGTTNNDSYFWSHGYQVAKSH